MVIQQKGAFTLIEILISTVILGILFSIIFSTYTQVSNLLLKIENERNLSNEILFLSQNVQNLADSHSIDFSKYSSNLGSSEWYTDTLYFTWDYSVSIYLTWDYWADISDIRDSNSWVEMERNWELIALTDPNKSYVRNMNFKILPFESIRWLDFDDIYNEWFWMNIEVYNANYSKDIWPLDLNYNYQTFYNIRQY